MAERSPLTLDDIVDFSWQGASDPDLSADGRHVVYTHEGALWLVETAGGKPHRLTEGARPQGSPVTNDIAYLRGQPAQVWIRDAGGKERRVTDLETGVRSFAWSPDGRRIAAISPLPAPAAADPEQLPETIIELHRPSLPPGHALLVIDPATAATEVVAESAPGVEWLSVAWRPDGQSLAVWERTLSRNLDEADHPAVLDLETGRMHYPAGRSRRPGYHPCWSPDGTRLAFSYSPHDLLHPFRTVLGVVDTKGGEVACFASDYLVEIDCWYRDNQTIYCPGAQGLFIQVLRIDTVMGEVQPITDLPGDHGYLRLSRDGQWLVCNYRTPTTLPEVYLLSTNGRERRRLTHVNAPLERYRLSETEIVRWRAPDGLEIDGLLVKPLEYEPGRRYPVIVDLHGGPVGGLRADFRPEWHWLAAQDYLVFAPDFRSGQIYGWYGPPDYIEQDFHDVMTGVDWLVEAGYANPDGLGVRGISYGGRLAAWIIGHTHRFRAALIQGTDLIKEITYATAGSGYSVGSEIVARELGGKPWEVPEAYRHWSPLTHVPNARTPTLIVAGEYDDLVQATMLHAWLHGVGVEVEYVKYLGETGEGFQKRQHRADYWRRTLAWFDRHLRS
jgi:dipeptidyl aminopeptidase/acylaminoacyl peptidase